MEKIIVLDFGSQYSHLIARRIRQEGVYSEILPCDIKIQEIQKDKFTKGIILSGSGFSIWQDGAPSCDKRIFNLDLPILGICYGHQYIAKEFKAQVKEDKVGEFGFCNLKILKKDEIFEGLKPTEIVWMSHYDSICNIPDDFEILAETKDCKIAAFSMKDKKIYGLQFHPEVSHTKCGKKIIQNFLFKICKVKKQWQLCDFISQKIKEAKELIKEQRAIIALSGGIDSSVACIIVSKAIGNQLTAVFIDTGLMRENEKEFIKKIFSNYPIDLEIIDASSDFFHSLKGIKEPEKKRQVIGRLFGKIFQQVADKKNAKFLIQGTIYSDRIESGQVGKFSCRIKSHHNVAALPKDILKLKIYEPLKDLYKDEVREIAKLLSLPDELIKRHVFPGPGFAIRVIGQVTPKKVEIVRKATSIIEEILKKYRLYEKVWMAFGVLLPIKTTGVQGDKRSYKYPLVVRIIESCDAMTAQFSKISHNILQEISSSITNQIKEVNRVVYDITNKPPATMEWE